MKVQTFALADLRRQKYRLMAEIEAVKASEAALRAASMKEIASLDIDPHKHGLCLSCGLIRPAPKNQEEANAPCDCEKPTDSKPNEV